MHVIQQKLLELAKTQNLADLTLRKMGELIGEPNSPQKIKHHLNRLLENELLVSTNNGKEIQAASSGLFNNSKMISLPIYGSANCGSASIFAEQNLIGYLNISRGVLDQSVVNKLDKLFVLKAVGNSMNRANIKNKRIEDGDYVIVEKNILSPTSGDYVVSSIVGKANIKKFYRDEENKQIVLSSESTYDFPPIYLCEDDLDEYWVCGRVVQVLKKPDEEKIWQAAACFDMEKYLPPLSQEEIDYYSNL